MSGRRATQTPFVQRHYKPDKPSCAHALKLLLKQAAGMTSTNGDEAKGSQSDRPTGSIP